MYIQVYANIKVSSIQGGLNSVCQKYEQSGEYEKKTK